jgi:ribonucleoside-diphosphate reductase alpha chain
MSKIHPAVARSASAAATSRLESLIAHLTTPLPEEYAATLLNGARALLSPSADEQQLEETLLHVALANQRDDPDYGMVARDLLLRRIYRDALASATPTLEAYRAGFVSYLERGVEQGLLDARLPAFAQAAAWLEPARDRFIQYLGLATLADRYLVKEVESDRLLETPQFLFMRVALGIALAEGEPLEWAVRFYERMSTLHYLPGTPTLFNAGTPHHQLSSCYVYDVHDDLTHILETTRDFGLLAKYAGGVGTSVAKLRAMGSPVRGVSGRSSGLIPFINMYDALFKAID